MGESGEAAFGNNLLIGGYFLCEASMAEPAPVQTAQGLKALFSPGSVAVVGAAREAGKVGRVIFDNILADFRGPVYPVNPKAAEIHGRPAFAKLTEIDRPVDLVVVAVPAPFAKSVVEEAGRSGGKAASLV